MAPRPALAVAVVAAAIAWASGARADDDPPPRRNEVAAVPVVAGNSDIGLQLGLVGSLTRFEDGAKPFAWRLDGVLSSSGKVDDAGFRLVQHSYLVRLDAPALLGGRLRLDTRASARRTINSGYFGLGNAAPAPSSDDPRRYQYVHQEGRLHAIGRLKVVGPLDGGFAADLRWVAPDLFVGSKAAEDAALLRGTRPMGLAALAAGVMVDTRDEEFVTTRGVFHQAGARVNLDTAGVWSGEVSASLAHYARLVGPLVYASRVLVSFQLGEPAFYTMQEAGVFDPRWSFGGDNGVRGVPRGRYTGKIKAIANHELRLPLPRFRLFGQRIRPGLTALFDVGRLWADYRVDPARDGTSIGLKYGVGGGVFGQWGEAAIVRADVAWSPDAIAAGLPIGFYVTTGLTF